MIKLGVLLFFLTSSTWALSTTSTRYEKGFFSLGLLSGYSQTSILNTDGSYTGFTGTNYAVQLEVSLTQSDDGEIRFFSQWGHEDLKEESKVFKLTVDNQILGLKFYSSPYLYLQGGYGQSIRKFKSSLESYKVQNPILSLAVGFDYPISEKLTLGVGGQYSTNPIKKTSSINSNSFAESGQYFLNLTWSPPITIINNTTNSGR